MLLSGAALVPGCATVLHPERQGNDIGPLDVGALILDILWFIPGIIPGIIALVVDFGTGAIYMGRHHHHHGRGLGGRQLAIRRGERLTVRAPRLSDGDDELEVTLRLMSAHETVLQEARGRWSPTHRDDLTVRFDSHRPDDPGEGRLELRVHGRGTTMRTATVPLHLGVDPAPVRSA